MVEQILTVGFCWTVTAWVVNDGQQDATSKIFVHPLKISKIHFSLKTPEIGKFLQRQENSWVLNASPFFLRKLR